MAGEAALTIAHRVSIPEPRTHLVHVETTVSAAARSATLGSTVVLFMPVWAPGSYLVREYARHVEGFVAGAPAHATKLRKNAWAVTTGGADRVVVRYRVYAAELTVRTSHVDETHALLIGAGLFMAVEGHEALGAELAVEVPAGWRITTSLPRVTDDAPGASGGATRFTAPDFDTLVDSPIEIGTHREERFDVLGKPHRYSLWPADAARDADVRRLVDDTRRIIETIATLFDGRLALPVVRAAAALREPGPRGPRARGERLPRRARGRASSRATAIWISCRSSRTRSFTPGT